MKGFYYFVMMKIFQCYHKCSYSPIILNITYSLSEFNRASLYLIKRNRKSKSDNEKNVIISSILKFEILFAIVENRRKIKWKRKTNESFIMHVISFAKVKRKFNIFFGWNCVDRVSTNIANNIQFCGFYRDFLYPFSCIFCVFLS